MNNEETVYTNKPLEDVQENVNTTPNQEKEAKTKKSGSIAMKAAVSSGIGVMIGTAIAAAFEHQHSANETKEVTPLENEESNDITSEDIQFATTVSDDMEFGEAFAEARKEVGSGGAFEWKGNIYSTYTAEEWQSMTPEEKDEYNSKFDWEEKTQEDKITLQEVFEDGTTSPLNDEAILAADKSDGIEILDSTPEVEILGVYTEASTNANVGVLAIDGQEVVLVDVDADNTFDILGADLNNDGVISSEEIADISGENISVSEFEESCMGGEVYAMGDSDADYINDASNDFMV